MKAVGSNPDNQFAEFRFSFKETIEKPPAIISFEGNTIATPGNIVVISGGSKSGKSYVAGAIIAGSLVEDSGQVETLGLSILSNKEKRGVIYINTELSRYDFQRYCKKIHERAAQTKELDFFWAMDFCGQSPEELLRRTIILIDFVAHQHGGVRLIVIDGIADFVSSVNSEEECNAIIMTMHSLARKLDAVILLIIHTNPIQKNYEPKTRGHLGSQIERKCESLLEIHKSKGGDHSSLSGKLLRNSGGFSPLLFAFDTSKGYPVAIGTKSERDQIKKASELLKVDQKLILVLKEKAGTSLRLKTAFIIECLVQETKLSSKWCEDTLKRWVAEGKIVRINRGWYKFPK